MSALDDFYSGVPRVIPRAAIFLQFSGRRPEFPKSEILGSRRPHGREKL
jgi:hypothetical protein